ncbi:hypothetical protein D7Z54_17865 [Salibacterium salarium]|uniref:Adenosylcobinamide kinase n=1 Tax=Salibacterium salarium TaxID=284579 RepID=A0A3R9QRW9_9BACI|nr:bifunctional adenosylcobinamide kinase/adenosylcobinamide-phosphate guanylyltransferase [Salibacterium salarium]RSL32062.1 hypothetical protein D7Z54_17865 [Salibacterium salarium]
MLTFICGGVRSGKSSVGENIAETKQPHNSRLIYLATSTRTDEEMNRRIQHHQTEREDRKANWVTIEQSRDLRDISNTLAHQDIVFLDCLTTWLSNEMFGHPFGDVSSFAVKQYMKDAIVEIEAACACVIVISNDVFHEPVPEHSGTFEYVKTLGELHQYFVRKAETVIEMEAGEPLLRKGERF